MMKVLDLEPRSTNAPVTTGAMTLIRITQADDPTPEQAMRIVEVSGTLDFWDRPEEDIYTADDGDPI